MTPFKKTPITQSETLGEKLLSARKKLRLDLRRAETETKVAMKHLEALERGNYQLLPEPVYTRGFIRRSAEYYNLDSNELLETYSKEYGNFQATYKTSTSNQSKENLLRPHVADEWLKHPNRLFITPEVMWGSGISLFLLGIFGYVWFQVSSFALAPELEIVSPPDQLISSVEHLEIRGVTDPSATLKINNQAIVVDKDGKFSQTLKLIDGVNTIEISATNKAEKATTKIIQVLAESPQDED